MSSVVAHPWPSDLAPRRVAFSLRGQVIAGPVSLTGRSQATATDTGYWTAVLSGIPTGGAARVKAYRRLLGQLAGGAGIVKVPAFDREQAPWPVAGVYTATPSDFTDGTEFSDGTGFFEPVIKVTAGADAAIGATQIAVVVASADTIVGGEYFSVHGRLYRIESVLSVSGGNQAWAITPAVRAAIASGARLDFDRPVCRMRLAAEGEGDLDLERGLYGFPSMTFVEAV